MRDQAAKYGNGSYRMERIEQAMDYLLNSPDKEGDPKVIVRDLMGGAGSKIRNRINLLKEKSELTGIYSPISLVTTEKNDLEHLQIEFIDTVERSPLDDNTKDILKALCFEYSTEALATQASVSVGTMRTRVSRARNKCREVLGVAL